jgi:hypothetical protein
VHCQITLENNDFFMEDLKSKFGVLFRMRDAMEFDAEHFEEEQIQVGRTFFRVKIERKVDGASKKAGK